MQSGPDMSGTRTMLGSFWLSAPTHLWLLHIHRPRPTAQLPGLPSNPRSARAMREPGDRRVERHVERPREGGGPQCRIPHVTREEGAEATAAVALDQLRH